jgi:gamma-glutamylcyclotransferase (GGCT)/AIG2-like uncharacterized protein YtfP
MLTFAYGSNLDEAQIRRRCPSVRVVCRAWLPDHRLVFSGTSKRGGAVANALPHPGSTLPGLVYEISEADGAALDRFEGCPRSYRRHEIAVLDEQGQRHRAVIYLRANEEPPGAPRPEYLETIRRAYARLGFGALEPSRAAAPDLSVAPG